MPPAYGAARADGAEEKARAGADRAPHHRAHAGGLPGRRSLVRRAEVQVRCARAGAAFADRRADRVRLLAVAGRARHASRAGPVHRLGLHRHRDGRVQPGRGGSISSTSSDKALALARENIVFQHVDDRVRAIKSDLFAGLKGERLRPDRSQSALRHRAGIRRAAARIRPRAEDRLDRGRGWAGLRAAHTARGAGALERGRLADRRSGRERARLTALLPEVPFNWIEFKVGQMGVFAIDARRHRSKHANAIRAAAHRRSRRMAVAIPSANCSPSRPSAKATGRRSAA